MIDSECTINPFNGILEGPKYLLPLSVGMPSKLCINFFAVPAKLLHKPFFVDKETMDA